MIDENSDNQNTEDKPIGAETSEKIARLKDIGLKGLTPLLNVVQKHKTDLNPYFEAVDRAIKAGVNSLNVENSTDVDRKVGSWLSDGSTWLSEIKYKVDNTNPRDLFNSLEEEARKRPAFMFAVSYVAGLVLGRLGRHLRHEPTIH